MSGTVQFIIVAHGPTAQIAFERAIDADGIGENAEAGHRVDCGTCGQPAPPEHIEQGIGQKRRIGFANAALGTAMSYDQAFGRAGRYLADGDLRYANVEGPAGCLAFDDADPEPAFMFFGTAEKDGWPDD